MNRPPRIDRPSVGLKRTPPEKAKRSVPGHLKFIRDLPCVAGVAGDYFSCGGNTIQAAHVRNGTDGGTGVKPHDRWAVPMCAEHHAQQHLVGEVTFWGRLGIDPVQLAERLWRVSGDHKQAARAIERAYQSARLKQGVE